MPKYFVKSSNIKIKKKIKEKLAKKITKIHNEATGANKYFAQVIFNDTKKGNHFMGGKKVSKPEIFISTDNLNYFNNIKTILKKFNKIKVKKEKKIVTIKTKYYLKAERKGNKINSLVFSYN